MSASAFNFAQMVSLYRDPNGENVFQTSNTDPHASAKMERALSKTFSKREFDNSLMKEVSINIFIKMTNFHILRFHCLARFAGYYYSQVVLS